MKLAEGYTPLFTRPVVKYAGKKYGAAGADVRVTLKPRTRKARGRAMRAVFREPVELMVVG